MRRIRQRGACIIGHRIAEDCLLSKIRVNIPTAIKAPNDGAHTKQIMKKYIGVDCGLSGAIVIISERGLIENRYLMPTAKAGKGYEIDINQLYGLIFGLKENRNPVMIIEDPGYHAPSAAGLRSMTYSYACMRTMATVLSLPHHLIRAQTWQKLFFSRPAKMPKGQKFDTKAAALRSAQMIWPKEDWTPTERARKPHDGLVDAALIAEWGRRNNL